MENISFGLHFDPPPSGIDWSVNYHLGGSTFLNDYSKQYYSGQVQQRSTNQLVNEGLYRPENAKGEMQILIIGCYLHHVKIWYEFIEKFMNWTLLLLKMFYLLVFL